jgi:hypothetical protein
MNATHFAQRWGPNSRKFWGYPQNLTGVLQKFIIRILNRLVIGVGLAMDGEIGVLATEAGAVVHGM